MSKLGMKHLHAVKWVLRYLEGTPNHGLMFEGVENDDIDLYGCVEFNYVSDLNIKRSTTSYVFILVGREVSWKFMRQGIVSLSIIEAGYIVVIEATKEALWLKGLINEFEKLSGNIDIYCDSQ